MIDRIDTDPAGAASHTTMLGHVAGPFRGGARLTVAPIDALGVATIEWDAREPLVLVVLKDSRPPGELVVEPTLDPGTPGAIDLPPLRFAGRSERGSSLPAYRPPIDPGTRRAVPFRIGFRLNEPAAVVDTIEVHVVEGLFGRMLYLLGAEKQRIRRLAADVRAMRALADARDDALDRIGAETSVPRFAERLELRGGEIATATAREPDDAYRRRLRPYRPRLLATRRNVLELLNGPGADPDPNRGPLGEMGLAARFKLLEEDDPLALAISIVAAGSPPDAAAMRTHFFDLIRSVHLVEPAVPVPADRFIPAAQRTREDALRARLGAHFDAPGARFAFPLALALDRAGRVRATLGATTRLRILRAQDASAGSRYELGLGIDLEPLLGAELDLLASRVAAGAPAGTDPEVASLIRAMRPIPASDDPDGRWFFAPCGLRTVHRVATDRLYLSHLPTFGLAVTVPSVVLPRIAADVEAHYHAPGDPGRNAALLHSMDAAAAAWNASGGTPWTSIPDASAPAAWSTAVPPGVDAANVLGAAGLPVARELDRVRTALGRLPSELIETVRLDPGQAARILGGDVAAIDELRRMARIFTDAGVASLLPLVTPTGVLLVAAALGLPEAGLNLSGRRATGFRWFVVPIHPSGGDPATLRAVGSRTLLVAKRAGLFAVVCVGYARRALTDPYEVRVELPDHATLTLEQYEYLMNLLARACPMGVEINTFAIRRRHVDLDGLGGADPLPPSLATTFRAFVRRRHAGETAITLEEP